jgi:hypothetical protein
MLLTTVLHLLHHVAGNGLRAQEGAFQVDRQDALEILFLQIEEIRANHDAGVVDQDIDVAIGVQRLGNQIADVQPFGDVAMDIHCVALRFQIFRRRFTGFVIHIGNHDLRAISDKALGDCKSDPPGCPGDDGDLIFQRHGNLTAS